MHKNLALNFETRHQMSLLLWLALKEKICLLGLLAQAVELVLAMNLMRSGPILAFF